jgi:glycosyltransferase involved in cell wall biosynthesis
MRVAFLVGDVVTISGGSNVIIEYGTALERLGHEVHVLTRGGCDVAAAGWHPRLKALRVRDVGEVTDDEEFDFAFATWWLTFFDLHRVRSAAYGYLNQSVESRFHGEEHYKVLNRCTYALPLLMITEARWIADFIRAVQPASRVLYIRNGLSREYFPRADAPSERNGPLRVLVEGPWNVPFKGVPETFEVLREAQARGVAFEAGWLTSNSGHTRPSLGPKPVAVHERVAIDGVRDVLRRYDVMVKLSRVEGMYGPPLEMFSQGGTAITHTVTGSDEYMVHGYNGLLVEPHNRHQIVAYLDLLARRPEYLASLRRNALATARDYPGWEESGGEMARALEGLREEGFTNAHLRPALAAISRLEVGWLEELWRRERLSGPVGQRTAKVLDLLRAVKHSRPYQLGKRLLPASMRGRVRARLTQVLR